MKGFPSSYTPASPNIFLLVRIHLKDFGNAELFEKNGEILRSVFEKETELSLVAGCTSVGVGDQSKLYVNFWKLRPERFSSASHEFASGGTRDLLPAMAIVHDIPQYGPVDDLVRLEQQELFCEFITGDPSALDSPSHPRLKPGDLYYVLVEYEVSSGEAGSLAFDLRAHLANFEVENNWVCVTTCFPMTGPLTNFVQVFKATSAGSKGKMLEAVEGALSKVLWKQPERFLLLRPTAYDSSRVHPGEP